LVALLAIVVFINYVDRGNLATAAPLLQVDLKLSNTQVGLLLSAFYWTYAPLQLLAGWMAERLDAQRLLAAGLAVWSLATMMTGFAGSFMVLLALRLLLGLGESAVYPSIAKLLGMRALEHQRGKANGTVSFGQALGPTIGTLGGGLLMAQFGWRAVMVTFGALSLLWLWPWIAATWRSPSTVGEGGALRPPTYFIILRRRAAWAACLGHFCNAFALYFVLGWLPLFLVRSRGFSVVEMSKIGAAVYCLYALSCAATGWASDRWILAGQSPNLARKAFIVTGMLGTAGCMFVTAAATPTAAVLTLLAAGLFFGLCTPMVFVIAQTLAGPRAAGQWMGVQNFFGNLSGIFGPVLTGFLIDRTGNFFWAFAVAGAIALIGAFAYGIAIPSVETLQWPEPMRPPAGIRRRPYFI
jgi:MFS family permease